MAVDVTSWFIDQTLLFKNEPVRSFTIGGSDYSDHVIRWPKLKQTYNSIRPVTLTIQLANEDQQFNFIKDDTVVMNNEALFNMGFTHPTSGDELLTMFSGKIERAKFKNGRVDVSFVDKFKQLTERVIGTHTLPINYVSSNYLPADIAWDVITAYGGYSSIASTSNADIDYESWLNWSNVFSADAVFVNATFAGKKVSEALKKIANYTDSAIFVSDNKINFKRFSLTDSNQTLFDDDSIKGMVVAVDNRDVINKTYVSGLYDVSSKTWDMTVDNSNATSINSYGLKEDTIRDINIWYINSGSALNLAQRKVNAVGVPFSKLEVDTTLRGLPRIIGETISVTDLNVGVSEGYRVMGKTLDMDKGTVKFNVDRSYFSEGFRLDTSTLGSSAILT